MNASEGLFQWSKSQWMTACATLGTSAIIDALAIHNAGAIFGGAVAAYIAAEFRPELVQGIAALSRLRGSKRPAAAQIEQGKEEYREERETEPFFTFSTVLNDGFLPSLKQIYLATLEDGTPVHCLAKDLCHVALAGSTDGGKSSIMRLLMAQLCKAGASVLLLNPHYTRFDIDHNEDWTPYERYLVHDPMQCRKYEVIEHYLHQIATVLLPDRLEKYAHSKPVGKPYFLLIDELPAIVKHVPMTPDYLSDILREGRKVGIFLITASQDFLVKTISPQGGGGVRDCYRTAAYVGGDPTTAKVLLDMPANLIPEDKLGKGTIMLRCATVKQAKMAYVPYVDNASLYKLLGPSTFTPEKVDPLDDTFLERLSQSLPTVLPPTRNLDNWQPKETAAAAAETKVLAPSAQEPETEYLPKYNTMPPLAPKPQATGSFTRALSPELRKAYNAFESGMTSSDLGEKLGCHRSTAHRHIRDLKDLHFITLGGEKIVS